MGASPRDVYDEAQRVDALVDGVCQQLEAVIDRQPRGEVGEDASDESLHEAARKIDGLLGTGPSSEWPELPDSFDVFVQVRMRSGRPVRETLVLEIDGRFYKMSSAQARALGERLSSAAGS